MAVQDEDIIIVNDCDCGCHCNDVVLHTDHQPEVLLFDEYGELYENDIIETRNIVEQIWDYVREKAVAILTAIGLVQGDVTTIKNEQRQGITDIRADIEAAKNNINNTAASNTTAIRGDISTQSTAIKNKIDTKSADIMARLNDIYINQEVTECTEAEVDAMFPDIEPES